MLFLFIAKYTRLSIHHITVRVIIEYLNVGYDCPACVYWKKTPTGARSNNDWLIYIVCVQGQYWIYKKNSNYTYGTFVIAKMYKTIELQSNSSIGWIGVFACSANGEYKNNTFKLIRLHVTAPYILTTQIRSITYSSHADWLIWIVCVQLQRWIP